MPIFDLDTGRPTVIEPMRPAAGTFDSDGAALVSEHLTGLLGEPLLPVAVREGRADAPHLLAVDAAGQPVVVEVVQVLDSAALTRSLRYAGTAARLSSVDLARAYRSGPEEFAADLVAFREGVPVASAHAAARHGGARLFVLCSEVAENVVDAVEFLRGPGRQVEVLQLGVVRGADGRRFAEVSPLVASVPRRRAVEPSTLRVLPATGAQPVLGGDPRDDDGAPGGAASGSARERVVGALAPTGTFPSVLPVPVGPVGDAADEPRVEPVDDDGPIDHDDDGDDEARVDREDEAGVEARVDREDEAEVDARVDHGAEVDPAPAAHPTLVALAGRLGGTTTLVWRRLRRGQRFVVTLRDDGRLELPDGTVFADPDDAATTAADAESPVDGWRAWRVGDDGPALVDAVEAADA